MTGYLIVSAVLLTCGVVCMATKRNAVGVGLDGQIAALFVIVLAAAEAAVALAIVLAFFNQHGTADVDAASELRG